MHRDGQDIGVAIEHPLHTIAVVGVGVDVGDADAGMLLSEARDRDAGVVVDAEAAGPRTHGVVQPARDAHGVVLLPRHYEPACGEHAPYHAGAGLVHVGEGGVIRCPEAIVQEAGERARASPRLLDHTHVGEAVDRRQVLVGRGPRGDERIVFEQPEGFAEFECEPDAQGIERMVTPEAVALQGQVVDDGGPAAQSFGGHRTEYPASSRYPTTSVVSMVSTRKTTMRSLIAPSSSGSLVGPMAALTMLMSHIPKMPAAPARDPGLSGTAISMRLPGSLAPTK